MQHLTILGSTGSIGTQTLDVVRRNPDRFRAAYLTTKSNIELLGEQIREFRPDGVVVCEGCSASVARKLYGSEVEIFEGDEAICDVAARDGIDTVVNGLVGFAGLEPTVAAIRK